MARVRSAAFALLASLVLVPPAPAADIPVVISLTGNGAFLGRQQQMALNLIEGIANAADGVHGGKLHFAIEDDQSDPQIAVQLATSIVEAHPAALLGSSLVASCNAMTPLFGAGPVMYCFSAGYRPKPGSFDFAAGSSSAAQDEGLVRYLQARGWTRLALIATTDASGVDAERDFDEVLARPAYKNVRFIVRERFGPRDVSVAAQIERIRAAEPQLIMVASTGAATATAFRGIAQAGIRLPVATLGGNMTYAQMRQFASFLPRELYLANPEWPAYGDARLRLDPRVAATQKQLYDAYAAAGIKPDAAAVGPWDPAMIVVDALRALPAGAAAGALRDRIAHLQGFPGVHGLYDFVANPQRGLSIDDILVTRWDAAADRWLVVSAPGGAPLAP